MGCRTCALDFLDPFFGYLCPHSKTSISNRWLVVEMGISATSEDTHIPLVHGSSLPLLPSSTSSVGGSGGLDICHGPSRTYCW